MGIYKITRLILFFGIALGLFLLLDIFNTVTRPDDPPKWNPAYRGADLMEVSREEVIAFRWDGKRYREMWRRK